MNPQKQSWPIVRSCLLVIVTALSIAACAGPVVQVSVPAQKADKKTNKDMLQMCAVVSDQDMSEIRGGYGFYSFGLDFVGNLDFASKRIDGSVKAWAVSNKDLKTNQNFTNGQVDPAATGVSFEAGNSQVAFHSSVGKSSLGTGVVQLVQVMGNNNVVYATTNVTLNIKNFAPIKPTVSGIGGLNFMGR